MQRNVLKKHKLHVQPVLPRPISLAPGRVTERARHSQERNEQDPELKDAFALNDSNLLLLLFQ